MDAPDPAIGVAYQGVLRTLPEDTGSQSDQAHQSRGEKARETDTSDSEDSHRNSVFLSGDDDSLVHRGVLRSPDHQAHIRGTNSDRRSVQSPEPQTAQKGHTHILGSQDSQRDLGSLGNRVPIAQQGVHRTLNDSGPIKGTRSDAEPVRASELRLRCKEQTDTPRSRKNPWRDAAFFCDDSVDSVAFSDSYDDVESEDLGTPSTSHKPDDDEGMDETEDDDEDDSQMSQSSDRFVFWGGPVSSPLPRKAVIRSNSVSIPLSKLSLPDLDQDRNARWSQPVFQYATLERMPLVGTVDVRAEGESWGQGQSSSKSESDLRLLEGEQESSTLMSRGLFHASNPALAASTKDTLETFISRTHEGYLWLNNILLGTQTKTWCIIHRETLLMFESNRPQSHVLDRWRLAECKVMPVSQKVALDLLVKFSTHHSFQIKRATEKKSVTIFSTLTDYLCKEWLQKLTTASNTYWKRKGSRLSFPSFSLKAHFAKSARSAKHKSKGPGPALRMSKKSFDDIYGWSEEQSHKRVNGTLTPVKENVQRAKTEKKQKKSEEFYRPRANSDMDLSKQAKKEPVDRSASAETIRDGGKFGSLRRTLKKLPQSKQPVPPSSSATRARQPLKVTQSIPLEPSVRAGLLLVKRFTSWNRCWVKLQGSNVHFFKDRHEQLPFEVFSLAGYEVHCTSPSSTPGRQVRFKFSLVCQDKESIHFLADTELDGRLWVKRFMEACTSGSMETLGKSPSSSTSTKWREVLDDADPNCNDTSHSDASGSPTESPRLRQKRIMIQRRYQEANETEEMNMMKRSLVLSQRRMSAQSKLDALDRQFGKKLARDAKNKKRNKSGEKKGMELDCDDASIQKILKELHRKVQNIDRELNENVLRSDQRKQALLKKQEMELEILQQERALLKCRSQAQAALKSMMINSSGGTQKHPHHLPLSLVEEREDDPSSLNSAINDSEFANGSYGQLQRKNRNSPSVSSSMSSLSSSSTSDSSGAGSIHSSSRFSPRVERVRLSNRSTDSVDGPGQLMVDRPLRERHSPAVSTPDLRRVCDRIPENGFPTEGSVEAPAVLVTPDIRPKRRTEVPPDVLRDIDEFEEMAKLALKKAGWLPLDAV